MSLHGLKPILMGVLLGSASYANALTLIYDAASLQSAVALANNDPRINELVFANNARIALTAPVIYTGSQSLTLIGNNATIDGSAAGSFVLDENLTAVTEDGSLIFNTSAELSIFELTVSNSATRGIVVNLPEDAGNDDITINLNKVNIINSALYGLHIDDNDHAFDDGLSGSDAGIRLHITHSNFTGNGTGALDFDGVRVDERSRGSIEAVILHTHIDRNGGDGIELDEAGEGDVNVTMMHVSLNGNGFYNEADLDDGFDIDETGDGDVNVRMIKVEAKANLDEGLDFDETGNGHVEIELEHVTALNNRGEALKVDEEGPGGIKASLHKLYALRNGDDGIQFTELGEGRIEASLKTVTADRNKYYGISIKQWFVEGEKTPVEEPGELKTRKVSLSDNSKGDEIKTHNINLK